MTEIKVDLSPEDLAAIRLVLARSDRGSENTPGWLRLRELLHSIEQQVKPAVEEPTEFGSLVRAGLDGLSDRVLWIRTGKGGWLSEHGSFSASYDWLDHPEVLRVGVGQEPR